MNIKPSSKVLLFFTGNFPYTPGEEFIETEITYTAKAFNKVVIIPSSSKGELRSYPSNCQIDSLSNVFVKSENEKLSFGDIKEAYRLYRKLKSDFKPYKPYLLTKRDLFSYCREIVRKRNAFVKYIGKKSLKLDEIIVYSYWNDDTVTALSLFKKIGLDFKLISRAHQIDLYEEYNDVNGFILHRKENLEGLDKLVLIAKQGYDYISNKYPDLKNKFSLSYLGTVNIIKTIQREKSSRIHIVSCSYINPRKRIHLIIEILKHSKLEIDWTHIGDGKDGEKDRFLKMAKEKLPDNINSNFLGQMSNTKVLEFYQNNWIDCFVLLSDSEGLPVSLMEVASFGIPMVATNAGGVGEIVNQQTGVLLDVEFDPIDACEQMEKLLLSKQIDKKREGVRSYWEDHFNAESNYAKFIKENLL